jgi:hypothetical protein
MFVDLDDIETREECIWLMTELDDVIADIASKIQFLSITPNRAVQNNYRLVPMRRAKKGARNMRMQIQARMGELKRQEKEQRQKEMQLSFIDAAMTVLPKETVQKIWDVVHMND